MRVEEIMSKAITIDKDRKLSDAIELMEKNNVANLVVIDEGKTIGMVTEKDITRELGSGKHGKMLATSLHVSSAMSSEPITISKDADIKEAAEKILKNHISSLPVVGNGELVGIINTTDLIRPLQNSDAPIKQVMSKHVVTVLPSDRVVHARRLMLDNDISRVVVVEGDSIVGIVTEKDTVKALFAFKKYADNKQFSRIRNLLVEDIMKQNIITLDEDSKAGEAAKLMLENNISGLPIIRNGELVGIVTKTDLMKLYV